MPPLMDQTDNSLFIQSKGLAAAGVAHAFSTRAGGVVHGSSLDTALPPFLTAAGFPAGGTPIPLRQVHGSQVYTLARGERVNPEPSADGAATNQAGIVLLVRTADCVPVLLAHAAVGVVGVIHAGWRGALAGVVARTLEQMVTLGASPASIRAAIGPAIGACCFQVGEEVAAPFARLSPALVERRGRHGWLDLPGAVAHLLRQTGVPSAGIDIMAACTRCHTDRFYSHRGENGRAGRLLSAIAAG